MIVVGIVVKLLLKLIVGVIGKKLSLALVMAYLGIRAAHANGAGRILKRAGAWLRATRRGARPRPRT